MIKFATITALSYVGLKVGRAIMPYLGKSFIPSSEKYIMVIGCTDGIGKEYAKHLSRVGAPLILVGRNK
jgi:hypothetical protein